MLSSERPPSFNQEDLQKNAEYRKTFRAVQGTMFVLASTGWGICVEAGRRTIEDPNLVTSPWIFPAIGIVCVAGSSFIIWQTGAEIRKIRNYSR